MTQERDLSHADSAGAVGDGNGLGGAERKLSTPPRGVTEHGRWSCSGCATRWNGLRIEHCSGCHLSFTGTAAGDAHRRNLRCVDPKDLVREDGTPILELREDGSFGIVITEERRAALAKLREKR